MVPRVSRCYPGRLRAVETSIGGVLGLGDPYHVGIAVRDLDDAMRIFGETFGIGAWALLEAETPAIYRGVPSSSGVRAAYARSGGIYLELVQPTKGPWTASAFLEEHGEGIYHLGYWVDDMPAALARAEAAGIGVDTAMPPGDNVIAAYLDAKPTLGVHVELVSAQMRPYIENLVAKAEPQ